MENLRINQVIIIIYDAAIPVENNTFWNFWREVWRTETSGWIRWHIENWEIDVKKAEKEDEANRQTGAE